MRATSRDTSVRPAAVAGLFYPDDPVELRATVSAYLERAAYIALPRKPAAFIVPHAGYIYSGSTAAAAYRTLADNAHPRRVVVIGPSHRVYLRGLAVPKATRFETPLGDVPIDTELKDALLDLPAVIEADEPHRFEHSLEVQLPFLQVILGEFTLLPIVAGAAATHEVAAALVRVSGEDTIVLASSDLSHYLTYEEAQRVDAHTSAAILARHPSLTGQQACGAVPINGLLEIARTRELTVEELARCNSGDTAGDRQRVVGYGAYALYEA
jgi:AmmeMemoRadiSam system protein B